MSRRCPMVAWMARSQICVLYGSIASELSQMRTMNSKNATKQYNTAVLDQRINLHLMFDSSRLSQTRWECVRAQRHHCNLPP